MPLTLKRERDPKTWDDVQYTVTMFRPHGAYPSGTLCVADALFHADEDMVFMCTHGRRWAANKELPYSEVDWLDPQVVRLAGAMMMATQFEDVSPRFYPDPRHRFVADAESVDLSASGTAREIKAALLSTVENPDYPSWVHLAWKTYREQDFPLFDARRLELSLLPRYWDAIDIDNHVLMRGLQALIKSDMLGHFYEFQEEGCIQTFIAMDASHQLVLEHLHANGISNPTSTDAGDWLYRTFDEPLGVGIDGMRYFEEFYEQRIQTVHPRSRFGDIPFAPLMVDDRMHLRGSLPSIFGYLVLGEHSTSFQQSLERAAARNRNTYTKSGS